MCEQVSWSSGKLRNQLISGALGIIHFTSERTKPSSSSIASKVVVKAFVVDAIPNTVSVSTGKGGSKLRRPNPFLITVCQQTKKNQYLESDFQYKASISLFAKPEMKIYWTNYAARNWLASVWVRLCKDIYSIYRTCLGTVQNYCEISSASSSLR